jgi:hypothetical protein
LGFEVIYVSDEKVRVEVILQRTARWLELDPVFIELSGRLFPGDVKRKLSLEMVILNDTNKINDVKVVIHENQINNVKWKEFAEDEGNMMAIQVGGNIYQVNKYLVVKSFKRLLVNKFSDHWPEFYGSDDSICYDDWRLMKDIDSSLMVIWSVVNYKTFKIGIEGSIVAKVTLNRNINVKVLIKELRRNYGLGKDIICMDIESNI